MVIELDHGLCYRYVDEIVKSFGLLEAAGFLLPQRVADSYPHFSVLGHFLLSLLFVFSIIVNYPMPRHMQNVKQ